MKKIVWICLLASLFASDTITIDSLYKKQYGLRSITTLSILSSGNANTYSLYPDITIQGNQIVWSGSKALYLNQTFIYSLLSKLDFITSVSGSFIRREYTHYETGSLLHRRETRFDAFWFGFLYSFDSIGDMIPQISLQTSAVQKEKMNEERKNFYFQSQSLQLALRGYSDPVVYSIYLGAGYNQSRKFALGKVDYGSSLSMGGNLSIVLSPKITLDLGAEQRFQTAQKVNGNTNSQMQSIPTMSAGSTYSINSDTSIAFSASLGGSSAAPDAIFGISLWKKF
ncbi:MAG: hypothetical protein K2O85_04495 [Helicobacter sp.]|nr:hypothetical protein [Helicobacter sp.]